eukprot:scaffold973_cov115-Skeletonema_dohrnii-CCMP3373.AAC.4
MEPKTNTIEHKTMKQKASVNSTKGDNASKKNKVTAAASNAATKESSSSFEADSVSRNLKETALVDLTNSPAKSGGVRNKTDGVKKGVAKGGTKGVTNSAKWPKKGAANSTKGGKTKGVYDSGIVALINSFNSNPTQRTITKLVQQLWINGYDSVAKTIKNTATTNEEGKRMLLEMLTALKTNVAMDGVGALGELFPGDKEIQSKLKEWKAAKSKSHKKQTILALAASQLNVLAKTIFPGASSGELRVKSIFSSNAESFRQKTRNAKRKDSNDKANEANKRLKTAKDDLVAAMETGDQTVIAAARLTLRDAEETANTAYAKSENGKQNARNHDSNNEANEAKQQVSRIENDLALALTTGADEARIAELELTLRDAKETANTAYAKSRNGKTLARRKDSNDKANEAKQQVKTAKDDLVAAMETGDQTVIAAARLTLRDAEETANTAYAKSRNGKTLARRKLIKVGDRTIDRRTLFSGLDEAIVKQEENENTTESDHMVAGILQKAVQHCESSQDILAKIKDCLEKSGKE